MNESSNIKIHPNVKSMLDKVYNESYNLTERFKNLEDPLRFIHNKEMQKLVDKTKE